MPTSNDKNKELYGIYAPLIGDFQTIITQKNLIKKDLFKGSNIAELDCIHELKSLGYNISIYKSYPGLFDGCISIPLAENHFISKYVSHFPIYGDVFLVDEKIQLNVEHLRLIKEFSECLDSLRSKSITDEEYKKSVENIVLPEYREKLKLLLKPDTENVPILEISWKSTDNVDN